jgi:hypothetical protein
MLKQPCQASTVVCLTGSFQTVRALHRLLRPRRHKFYQQPKNTRKMSSERATHRLQTNCENADAPPDVAVQVTNERQAQPKVRRGP